MSSLSSDLGSSSSSLNNNSGNSANAADASCAGGNSPAVLVGSPSSLASGAIHNSSALILAEGWVSALSPETGHWDRNYCIIATANAAAAASDKAAASATPVSLLLFDNALAVATAPPQSSLAINKASVADYTDGSFDRASVFAVNGSVLATTAPEEKAAYLKLLAQGGANVATSHINKNTANANSSSSSKAANLTLPSSSNAAAAGAAGGSATALTVTVPATPANGAAATGTGAGDGNGVGTVSTAVTGAAAVKTPTTGRSGTSRRLASANAPVVDIDALEKTDGLGVIAFAAPIWVCDPASSSKPAKLRYGVIRDWGLELYTVDAVDEFRRHARLAGPTSAHAELEALTRTAGLGCKSSADAMSPLTSPTAPAPAPAQAAEPGLSAAGAAATVAAGGRLPSGLKPAASGPSRPASVFANVTLPQEVMNRLERTQLSYHHLHQTVTLATPDVRDQKNCFTHYLKNTTSLAPNASNKGKFFLFSAGADAALRMLWLAVLQRHARYYSGVLPSIPDIPVAADRKFGMDLTAASLAAVAAAAASAGTGAEDDDGDDTDPIGNSDDDDDDAANAASNGNGGNASPTANKTRNANNNTASSNINNSTARAAAANATLDSFVTGSTDRNTKKGNFIKSKVSKKKRRFTLDSFDLDLTYITARVIAMGFPSVGTEALYRNDMKDVVRFFETRHPGHYKIYNLCSERVYPKSSFQRILHFPFDDHNPPPFQNVLFCIVDIARWLRADPRNVAGIHCKAGKGRTGLIITMLMTYVRMWDRSEDALRYYATVRTKNQKGVTIASQQRWVFMFENYVLMRDAYAAAVANAVAAAAAATTAAGAGTSSLTDASATAAANAAAAASTETKSDSADKSTAAPAATAAAPAAAAATATAVVAATTPVSAVSAPTASPLSPSQTIFPATGLPAPRLKYISSIKVSSEAPSFDTVIITCPCPASPETQALSPSFAGAVMGTIRSSKDKNIVGFSMTKVKSGLFVPAPNTATVTDGASAPAAGAAGPTAAVVVGVKPRVPGRAGSGMPAGFPGNSVHDTTAPAADANALPKAYACNATNTGGVLVTGARDTFVVGGDFNVKFMKTGFLGGQKCVFSFWLHSQFVELEGDRVVLRRCDMDKANKEKGSDFTVDITFGDV